MFRIGRSKLFYAILISKFFLTSGTTLASSQCHYYFTPHSISLFKNLDLWPNSNEVNGKIWVNQKSMTPETRDFSFKLSINRSELFHNKGLAPVLSIHKNQQNLFQNKFLHLTDHKINLSFIVQENDSLLAGGNDLVIQKKNHFIDRYKLKFKTFPPHSLLFSPYNTHTYLSFKNNLGLLRFLLIRQCIPRSKRRLGPIRERTPGFH